MGKGSADYVTVRTNINRHELMSALREMTLNCEDFSHRKWAIWDAETFENVARMIRIGYAENKDEPRRVGPNRLNIGELMIALRDLTYQGEAFDHQKWSSWNADILEKVAKMIRDGYIREDKEWRKSLAKKEDRPV